MTDQPEPIISTPAVETRSRWARLKPRGRTGRIAVSVISAVGALLIAGSVFTAGYTLGHDNHGPHSSAQRTAEAGHHRDGGGTDHGHDWRHQG